MASRRTGDSPRSTSSSIRRRACCSCPATSASTSGQATSSASSPTKGANVGRGEAGTRLGPETEHFEQRARAERDGGRLRVAMRSAASRSELDLTRRGLAHDPPGEVSLLGQVYGDDVAAGGLDGLHERGRAVLLFSSRVRKNAIVVRSVEVRHCGRELRGVRPCPSSAAHRRRSPPPFAAERERRQRVARLRAWPCHPSRNSSSAPCAGARPRRLARRSASLPWSSPWSRYAGLREATLHRNGRRRAATAVARTERDASPGSLARVAYVTSRSTLARCRRSPMA